MSNCTNAIILRVIKVTTDDISGQLPTERAAVGMACAWIAPRHGVARSLLPRWHRLVRATCEDIHHFHI